MLQDLRVQHRGWGLPVHCSLLPSPTSSSPSHPVQRVDIAMLRDSIDITPPHLLVTATCRFALPSSITSMTSSGLDTNLSVHPCKSQRLVRSAITVVAKQQHLKAAKHPFSPKGTAKQKGSDADQQDFPLAWGLDSTLKRIMS